MNSLKALFPSGFTFALLVALSIDIPAQVTEWSIQNSPSTQNLRAVTHIDSNTWIAAGDAGTILRSDNGGTHWTSIASPIADALRGISFVGDTGIAVGIGGRVLRTTDGGLHWTEETRPTNRNLYAVSMSNQMTVTTGEEGTILLSLDNGLTWTSHTAGTASFLFGVSVNGATAVGVGGQGAIVMSTDLGKGWGLTVLGQSVFFYSTSFVNGKTGWAVGSTSAASGNVIIRSTDYGFTWTAQTAPSTEQLFGVSFAAMDTGTSVGGNGTIIHTSDGGLTWLNQPSGTHQILNAVSFASARFGIAVGDSGTILMTTTGGTGLVKDNANRNQYPSRDKCTFHSNSGAVFLTLSNGTTTGNPRAVVYNLMGKVIHTETPKPNQKHMYFGNLGNSAYVVEINSGELPKR